MNKTTLAVLLIILMTVTAGITGCGKTVTGSGLMTSWEMANTDFNKIEISGGFDVWIHVWDDNEAELQPEDLYQVKIDIDQATFEYLVVDQRGDTLHIGLEGGNTYLDATRKASIFLPELKELRLSEGSKANVDPFSTSQSLRVNASGGSVAGFFGVTVGEVKLSLSGGSRITGELTMQDGDFSGSDGSTLEVSGVAEHIAINGSGGSRFYLPDFPVATADVKLSGASTANLNISDRIDVNLREASVINYTGEPRLGDINLSGGATVNQK